MICSISSDQVQGTASSCVVFEYLMDTTLCLVVSKKVAEHSTDTPQSELAAQQRAIETLKASWQRALLRHNQSVSEQHAFIGRHLEEGELLKGGLSWSTR